MSEVVENGRDNNSNGDKYAAEHLRSLRNVFSALIQRFLSEYVSPDKKDWETILNDEYGFKGKVSPNWSNALRSFYNNFASEKGDMDALFWRVFPYAFYPDESAYGTFVKATEVDDSADEKRQFESVRGRIKRILEDTGLEAHEPHWRKGFKFDSREIYDFDERASDKRDLLAYMYRNALFISQVHKGDVTSTQDIKWLKEMPMNSSPYIVWGNSASEPDAFPPMLVLPGSAYGPSLTKKLFAATQAMLQNMGSDMHMDQTRYVVSEAEKETIHSTARWEMDAGRPSPEKSSTRRTLSEGIASLGQSLALLSAEKVQGYENNADKLIEALIVQGLPNILANEIPAGIIGPFSLSGKYIPGLIRSDSKGELYLDEQIIKIWREDKAAIRKQRVRLADFDRVPAAGRGCPVSYKNPESGITGIQQLSCLFLEEYKKPEVQNLA